MNALRRVLGTRDASDPADAGDAQLDRSGRDRARLAEAWGFSDTSHPEFPGRVPAADPAEMAAPPKTTDYDREQWRRKLRRVLDHLPQTESQWADLMQEAGALAFDPDWVRQCERDEFALMVRRAVAGDQTLSPMDHHKLELARTLIGIPEAEAIETLHAIAAEAQEFFGRPVEGV